MAVEKFQYLQEKDGTRRIITEKWEMRFEPFNDSSSNSLEECEEVPTFKIFYGENSQTEWLCDAKIISEDQMNISKQKSKISVEVLNRVFVCQEMLCKMAQIDLS